MHSENKEDMEHDIVMKEEQLFEEKAKMGQESKKIIIGNDQLNKKVFDPQKITHFEDYKKNLNFTYMQSLFLISAYIAGVNREALDSKMFLKSAQKIR